MTADELKEAFFDECAVVYTVDSIPDQVFCANKIEEIVYKKIKGRLRVSATLITNANTLITVPSRTLKRKE